MNLKPEELVKALRLCGWYRDCDCENCPADDESDDWCHDTILSLAADQIERDQKEIEELRKELEWKDMVIALAQKKQTEAEDERDKLKEKVEQYRALIPSWVIPKEDTP